MLQIKRINVYNKKTDIFMRVSASRALSLLDDGYHLTTKSKLKCYLNKERRLSKNFKTLKELGIDINKPIDNKNKLLKMPSGKVHIVAGSKHLVIQFP